MRMRNATLLLAFGMMAALPTAAFAQASLEGPTGVCLTPLAYTLPAGTTQTSVHFVDLEPLGSLTTVGVVVGLNARLELGVTREALTLGGTVGTNVLHFKWATLPERGNTPALSVGAILRDPEGTGGSTADVYLVASKIIPAPMPVILSANVRSTDGIGFGLLGKTDRETELGGFVGVVVHPRLILGWEAARQPGGAPTWSAFCFRYAISDNANIDGGIADLGPGLDDQFAMVLTQRF